MKVTHFDRHGRAHEVVYDEGPVPRKPTRAFGVRHPVAGVCQNLNCKAHHPEVKP